ncbi:recombinase family protein [Paracraurococcus ruber]|uniref:Resolvase/invertase-type recombinase catalytic domain-containing protein n=1 Tax=Paracraurococcus ruber TaxID=77675 RepID=A0ABS1CVD4_9PROT|nr:hypothetical protein [Paracraurococcus ruber]TDG30563.1 recombinase family protein [Paracraurococcus ruber]
MAAIGYAWVSPADQDLALRMDALHIAGCAKVFEDRASGARADRAGLQATLDYAREGDVLVTWTLDRLGGSLPHLIETVAALARRDVGFRALAEAIDTTVPGGRLVFRLFAALGQFGRDLIRERTRAGLAAVATRGRTGGRKPVITGETLRRARALVAKGLSVRDAAARLKIGRAALYEALRTAGAGQEAFAPAAFPWNARTPAPSAWDCKDRGTRRRAGQCPLGVRPGRCSLTPVAGVGRFMIGGRADGHPATLRLELRDEARGLRVAGRIAGSPGAGRLVRDHLGQAHALADRIGPRRCCGRGVGFVVVHGGRIPRRIRLCHQTQVT